MVYSLLQCKVGVGIFCRNLRDKCRVELRSTVVRVQVKHPNHEGNEDHDEDDHKLEDVLDCTSQRNLERSKALIGWEDVGDA